MKKSCNECRALILDSHCEFDCEFGFKTEKIFSYGRVVSMKPLEECPKPRTYDEYFIQKKIRRNNK